MITGTENPRVSDMARPAMAREQIFALRQKIARIEGTQPERLEGGGTNADKAEAEMLVRRYAPASPWQTFSLGATGLDAALDGGIPRAALTEITSRQSRDAAVVTGFALGLAPLAGKDAGKESPVLWIGLANFFFEAGLPYAPGFEIGRAHV